MISAMYLSQEGISDEVFNSFLNYASEEVINRYDSSLNKEKGKAIVLGECLLKYILSKFLKLPIKDIEIKKDKGKPFCPQHPEFYLSLSHSGKEIFATISNAPVGCDVQEIKKISLKKIDCFFSEKDCKYIINNKNNMFSTFHLLWTKKECAIKMFGNELNSKTLSFCDNNFVFQNYNICFYTYCLMEKYIFTIASIKHENFNSLELKELKLSKLHNAYINMR